MFSVAESARVGIKAATVWIKAKRDVLTKAELAEAAAVADPTVEDDSWADSIPLYGIFMEPVTSSAQNKNPQAVWPGGLWWAIQGLNL
jgi:hypothetical protein